MSGRLTLLLFCLRYRCQKINLLSFEVEIRAARLDLRPLFGAQEVQPVLQRGVFFFLSVVLLMCRRYLLTDFISEPVGMDDFLHKPKGDKGKKHPAQAHTDQAQTVFCRARQKASFFLSPQITWSRGESIVAVVIEVDWGSGFFWVAGVHGVLLGRVTALARSPGYFTVKRLYHILLQIGISCLRRNWTRGRLERMTDRVDLDQVRAARNSDRCSRRDNYQIAVDDAALMDGSADRVFDHLVRISGEGDQHRVNAPVQRHRAVGLLARGGGEDGGARLELGDDTGRTAA